MPLAQGGEVEIHGDGLAFGRGDFDRRGIRSKCDSRETDVNGGAAQFAARFATIGVIGLTSDVIRDDLFFAVEDAEFDGAPESGGARLNAHGGTRTGVRMLG